MTTAAPQLDYVDADRAVLTVLQPGLCYAVLQYRKTVIADPGEAGSDTGGPSKIDHDFSTAQNRRRYFDLANSSSINRRRKIELEVSTSRNRPRKIDRPRF